MSNTNLGAAGGPSDEASGTTTEVVTTTDEKPPENVSKIYRIFPHHQKTFCLLNHNEAYQSRSS